MYPGNSSFKEHRQHNSCKPQIGIYLPKQSHISVVFLDLGFESSLDLSITHLIDRFRFDCSRGQVSACYSKMADHDRDSYTPATADTEAPWYSASTLLHFPTIFSYESTSIINHVDSHIIYTSPPPSTSSLSSSGSTTKPTSST
jgi:hypothetical protein